MSTFTKHNVVSIKQEAHKNTLNKGTSRERDFYYLELTITDVDGNQTRVEFFSDEKVVIEE